MSEEQCSDLGRKLSLRKTVQVGMRILECLQRLHSVGYCHRDFKPDNMLLEFARDEEDERKNGFAQVYLIDFGRALRYESEDRKHIKDHYTKLNQN